MGMQENYAVVVIRKLFRILDGRDSNKYPLNRHELGSGLPVEVLRTKPTVAKLSGRFIA